MSRLSRSVAVLVAAAAIGLGAFAAAHRTAGEVTTATVPAAAAGFRSSSAVVRSQAVDETAAWYQNHLGFRRLTERVGVHGRAVLLERDGSLLEVTEDDRLEPPAAEAGPPGTHRDVAYALLVPDVDAEIDTLQRRGVEILSLPRDDDAGEFRVAYVRDNERRIVALKEPVDEYGS
jgi:catechol 2,3-dioxygenase-like lactoylglutathione lyase family enzyme